MTRFHVHAGLGDEVAATGLVREWKRLYPYDRVSVDCQRPEAIYQGNPHVDDPPRKEDTLVKLCPLYPPDESLGNLVMAYSRQAGIVPVDPTPELYLDLGELATGRERVPGHPAVALDAWAAWPSRRWPPERYAEVARRLLAAGVTVIELGAPAPDIHGKILETSISSTVSYHGQLSVRESAAIIAASDLFIGNDSGLMHVAAAVGTPAVVPFGVKRWWSRAYWNTVPLAVPKLCHPSCHGDCADGPDFCLDRIEVDHFYDAVKLAMRRYCLPTERSAYRYSIAVVCHNRLDLTKKCIESIFRHTTDFEVILHDNASTDGTRAWLDFAPMGREYPLRVRLSDHNRGTIEPRNEALAEARGRFFISLDNDIEVGAGWVEALEAKLREPGVALCGFKGLPTELAPDGTGRVGNRVDYVGGGAMMGRTDILRQTGLFSTDFHFTYAEDADLGLRLRAAGYKLAVAEFPYTHVGGATWATARRPEEQKEIMDRNRKVLLSKWGGALGKLNAV